MCYCSTCKLGLGPDGNANHWQCLEFYPKLQFFVLAAHSCSNTEVCFWAGEGDIG